MHASAYIAPLEPLLQAWEEQLVGVQDTMDVWMKVSQMERYLFISSVLSKPMLNRIGSKYLALLGTHL